MNLGGGTHHAGRDFARGYCLFNDVAVALAGAARATGCAERALIVDCDVHQGDGTAQIFAGDPRTFTLSLHGARNYPFQRIPSDLDVDIAPARATPLPARARRGARLRARPRAGPTSRSTSPAPTRGRATGSAGSRSARPGCGRATSSCSTGCAAPAPPSASCSRAATRRTSATPSTSTPAPPRRSPSAFTRRSPVGAVPHERFAKRRTLPCGRELRRGSGRSASRSSRRGGPYDRRPLDSRHPSLPPAPAARCHRRRGGGTSTLASAPGGVVLTGTRRPCMPELGVRFPSPPLRETSRRAAARARGRAERPHRGRSRGPAGVRRAPRGRGRRPASGKSALLAAVRARRRSSGCGCCGSRGAELEREFAFGVVRQLLEPRPAAALTTARPPSRAPAGAPRVCSGCPARRRTTARRSPTDSSFAVLHGLYWLCADLAARRPLCVVWTTRTGPTPPPCGS